MPRVVIASALARWIAPDDHPGGELRLQVLAANISQCLEEVFQIHPKLRAYVLDEHGRVRHHLSLFVDGAVLADKTALEQPVQTDLYVMQALSGG